MVVVAKIFALVKLKPDKYGWNTSRVELFCRTKTSRRVVKYTGGFSFSAVLRRRRRHIWAWQRAREYGEDWEEDNSDIPVDYETTVALPSP